MPYTPTTWVDGSAPDIDAANLNNIETGITKAPYGPDASSSQVPIWNGSSWTYGLVANANVSATAAIAYGKLSLAASIVDADVSVSANLHKLAAVTGTPTGSKFLRDDGSWASASTTTYRKTTAKTVSNSVAETDLLNSEITVAANAMGTTGLLRLTAFGDWKQNSGVGTDVPRFKLKLGATTLLDSNVLGGGVAANSASRFPWRIAAEVMNLGAANSQWALLSGELQFGVGTTTGAAAFATGEGDLLSMMTTGTQSGGAKMLGANSAAVDTTAGQALVLSVILPAANASLDIVLKGALVEVL